jgi:hypothetical protein
MKNPVHHCQFILKFTFHFLILFVFHQKESEYFFLLILHIMEATFFLNYKYQHFLLNLIYRINFFQYLHCKIPLLQIYKLQHDSLIHH